MYFEPQYITLPQARQAVEYKEPEVISTPGKIYLYNNYLLVNEIGKGIHIINNVDKTNPRQVGFINIPGNFDMAVKGDILYADNYVDLLAFDISDLSDIKEVKRLESVFNDIYWFEYMNGQEVILAGYLEVEKSYVDDSDCRDILPDFLGGGGRGIFGGMNESADVAMAAPNSTPMGQTTGIGGSMARFTIMKDHLYSIDNSNMQIFDIADLDNPVPGANLNIGWGIETIFPYKDNLFIGSQSGMIIYDNSDPSFPTHLSTFAHIISCDPVVVENDIAYVTLRGGSGCRNDFTNQLDVIDISDLSNPKLLISYPMTNPHGLGIDNGTLFICEGSAGLKVYDASDSYKISNNLLAYYGELDAYDVIPYQNNLIMVGNKGLYQFDYSDPNDIKFLSVITISREEPML